MTNNEKRQENEQAIEMENVSNPAFNSSKSVFSRYESVIEWQAPEYEYYSKDVSWYWLSLIASIILAAVALWQKNFLFAVFVAVAWMVVINFANRSPDDWKFKINGKGIEIEPLKEGIAGKFYPYDEIAGFDIHPSVGSCRELILKFKSKLSPYLKININPEDEEKIEKFLAEFIPKEKYPESLADSFLKLVRF